MDYPTLMTAIGYNTLHSLRGNCLSYSAVGAFMAKHIPPYKFDISMLNMLSCKFSWEEAEEDSAFIVLRYFNGQQAKST